MSNLLDFSKYSDDQIREMLEIATQDLGAAAEDQPNSDWHSACFSAVFLLSEEVTRRGLITATIH